MKLIDNVPRESRWSVFYLLAALAVLAALVAPPQAYASSGFLNTWSSLYPGSASDNNASCQLCHGNSTQNINPYGFALAECNGNSGSISSRIQAVEGQDSDGQGDSNLVEINADAQPGWTTGNIPVWNRGSCNAAGTNTYQDGGEVDPPAANTPPVANNDSYATQFETELSIPAPGVLGNDTDADGDALTAVLQSDVSSGTLNLNANGSFTYLPAAGISGDVTFTYVANDGTDNSNVATVTITIGSPANTPPVANNDSYSTPFQTQLTVVAPGVLGNDTDADGDALNAVLQSGVSSGTLNLNANGSFTYLPATGISGDVTFTYVANDGTDNSNVATVTITIGSPANTPPVANNDSYNTPFETPLSIPAPGVLGNDTDADGDTLNAVLQTGVSSGTLNLNANGSFTYTPATGISGDVTFTYVANDGTDNSNVAIVTITIGSPANTPPVANNDSYSTPFDTLLTVAAPGVLGNDTDADGDALNAVLQTGVSSGTLNLNANGSFTYTPVAGFSGTATFTYVANDGTDNSNVATVTITVGAPATDTDNDGIPDNQDNCIDDPNGTLLPVGESAISQRDTNGDGFGNVCDPDLDNNLTVTTEDFSLFRAAFGTSDPDADLNGDGSVGLEDFSIFRDFFGGPPGPSCCGVVPSEVTARGDTYATPVGDTIAVTASRVSGVLYNDFGGTPPLTATLVSGPTRGSLDAFGTDGSFTYTPGGTMVDNEIDQFTYVATDANGDTSAEATVVLQTLSKQTDFKILMNYELGMHCTGFEFAYCCVLPPYNSIIAQVVKPAQNDPACAQDEHGGCEDFFDGYPRMLEGDPNVGRDGLNRETVVRDWDYTNSSFKKYQLRYYHDAQPRQEGNTSKPNTTTLIDLAEGNSLQYFNTVFDSAAPDPATNALVYGPKNGIENVLLGDGAFGGPTDNYANGWLNHFYIYVDPATGGPNLEGHGNTGLEADKIRLGVAGQVAYPPNSGAALQPLGPSGNGAFENLLTFSADTGTVVFTQAKVLEDLPIMLTSPRIWEALGMPLTPYEDTIGFFGDPGAVDEDSVRPFVAMKASLHEYPSGNAVIGSNQQPVIGFGTAPIDIPNCERCHSAPSVDPVTGNPNVNSPNYNRPDASYPHPGPLNGTGLEDMTNLEINFWMAYYDIVPGVDSDWYPRLKGAAINMLTLHDNDVGTSFTVNYAGVECSANPDPTDPTIDPDSYACSHTNGLNDLTNASNIPQNTRLGAESVICQRCHADNVIATVKSATFDTAGQFPIKPISEAIHRQHRNQSEGGVIVFNDSLGRDGGCQGCHPAHRSDGVMDDYPITLGGNNANAGDDNRLNLGGCFVGRDVHSNPMKDIDGAETPTHLNAVGGWLADNVTHDQGDPRGIWCTNCHTQLGQELWRTEDCNDLIHGDCLVNPRGEPTLAAVAAAVGLTEQEAIDFLDPKVDGFDRTSDQTHAIWAPSSVHPDADVATIEVDGAGNPVVTTDADGDISVNILSFCTTDDCVSRINANKSDQSQWRYPANPFIDPVNNSGFPVPFSAATDGRDHWLSAGEPHCADCHKAPYVEQSGNITAYPPFNYPAKASLMRYTRGHQDISCQGCHESIHGLYPVTPTIDTTSYAQAAALNDDGSHGPLKCATCHEGVDANGIPNWVDNLRYNDPNTPVDDNLPVSGDFDRAVSWMHTYTDEANPIQDVCTNCHGDESDEISVREDKWLEHTMTNRTSRVAMDKAERAVNNGQVFGQAPGAQRGQLCSNCHEDEENFLGEQSCDAEWREHLIEGRVSQVVWEELSVPLGGCGW